MPGGRHEGCVFLVSDKVTLGAYAFQLRVKIYTGGAQKCGGVMMS